MSMLQNRGQLLFKNKLFKNPRNPLAIQNDPSPSANARKLTTPIPAGRISGARLGAGYVPGLLCQAAEDAPRAEAVRGPGEHLPYLV